MATPASIRLPLRSLLRTSTHSNPTASIRRTPCCSQIISQTHRRHESTYPTAPVTLSGFTPPEKDSNIASTVKEDEKAIPPNLQLPRNVTAAYLRPLRRQAKYGIPSCDLQLRSYSVRNLEFFADFAIRAAYYLNLPAYGPVPLPRITERWTVPLGHFIHKKSQENFERKTLRRLIQIKDGNEETVGIWLAFLAKHAYYGIGMKANVWSFDKLGVGKNMDANMEDIRPDLEDTLDSVLYKKNSETAEKVIEVINRGNFRASQGGSTPMMERRIIKQNEARPWKHPGIPSDAAQRAVRKGV